MARIAGTFHAGPDVHLELQPDVDLGCGKAYPGPHRTDPDARRLWDESLDAGLEFHGDVRLV